MRDRGVTSYGSTTHLKMIMVAILGKLTTKKKENEGFQLFGWS